MVSARASPAEMFQSRSSSVAKKPVVAAKKPVVAAKKPMVAAKKPVAKKPVAKVAPKKFVAPKRTVSASKSANLKSTVTGKTRYANSQRSSVGGGTSSITGLVGETVTTLLKPGQIVAVVFWLLLVAKLFGVGGGFGQ